MPPLRFGRASRACELCRKQKTRCYTSDSVSGSCLRCKTLSHPCSLEHSPTHHHSPSPQGSQNSHSNALASSHAAAVDERLERLERTVSALVDRLDSRLEALKTTPGLTSPLRRTSELTSPSQREPAPVFLIRDAATDAGLQSPQQGQDHTSFELDVISTGLVPLSVAHPLLELLVSQPASTSKMATQLTASRFHIHYGRWVRFPEVISTAALLSRVRKSPLLLCSILLISVRHTSQELADRLAPKLFREAQHLVTTSLLVVPQSMEFFQASLILSLWSTTIGQVPLSIDSWLLTGYALQQAQASPDFIEVLRPNLTLDVAKAHVNTWCIWNHLCVAHLQYCVGTRRNAMINHTQVERCLRFVKLDGVTNYEERMVAEARLYWVIYEKCCYSQVDIAEVNLALQAWQNEWSYLFDQPRHQFLQMGFHFAHLLACWQSLKSPQAVMGSVVLLDIIRLCKSVLNLAIDTTDERTRHLTDHIYHIITFSALILCKLVHAYGARLAKANEDVAALERLIVKVIDWLRSIGLPCHAAHMLGDIISAQFQKLRQTHDTSLDASTTESTGGDYVGHAFVDFQSLPTDIATQFPNFIGSELYSMDVDAASWPQWAEMYPETTLSM